MTTTGSGSVSNSAVCFSSDARRAEGRQPAGRPFRQAGPGAARPIAPFTAYSTSPLQARVAGQTEAKCRGGESEVAALSA